MNHLLGGNGVGKSCFAKSCIGLFQYSGKIITNTIPVLIGSYSNIPFDLKFKDIMRILCKKYEEKNLNKLITSLNISNIPKNITIKHLSDGQRQKIKMLCFLVSQPNCVILDEFTSALDKTTSLEMYTFFNEYIRDKKITCINITHNLSDIEYMPGSYYLLDEKTIKQFGEKDEIIDAYIKGVDKI